MYYAYTSFSAVTLRRNVRHGYDIWEPLLNITLERLRSSRKSAVWSYCDGTLKCDMDPEIVLNEETPGIRRNPARRYGGFAR